MAKTYSWEVSDQLWEQVAPLIPKKRRNRYKKYKRKSGGGRKAIDQRQVFSGIVYVLRTGIQWKATPKEKFGSASAIHRYFQEWMRAGFFQKLWKKGLHLYDEMEGIAWTWQSIDGATVKAPLAQEDVGRNPTDRGKKWHEKERAHGRTWRPAVPCRMRSKSA